MTLTQTDVVERKVRIEAHPQTVFGFLTDPAKMLLWTGLEVTLEPQEGGVYRVNMNGRDVMRGNFVEVVPYQKVVFTFGWEGSETLPPGSSTVEYNLIPDGNNTILHLKHHNLPIPMREAHGAGWDHMLTRLVIVARGDDPGADSWHGSSTKMG